MFVASRDFERSAGELLTTLHAGGAGAREALDGLLQGLGGARGQAREWGWRWVCSECSTHTASHGHGHAS